MTVVIVSVWCCSPPERHQWGRRDRPLLVSSLVQDENFHHLLFSQHHQHVPIDESRQYNHTSTPPRMLHPAAHLPQQSPIMVDLHDQVTEQPYGQRSPFIFNMIFFVSSDWMYSSLICRFKMKDTVCCCVVVCDFGGRFSVLDRLCSQPISPLAPLLFLKDAPGISSNIIYCYHGDDPWISHPHRAAPSRVQHSAAPSMLGNVQRTALSALLPSSSCEFEKEEPKC